MTDGWDVGQVRCRACGHDRQVVVIPADRDTDWFECVVCHERAATWVES